MMGEGGGGLSRDILILSFCSLNWADKNTSQIFKLWLSEKWWWGGEMVYGGRR